ncbi:acyl carrier protein [Streptomyces canus]|uniref:phosphopantetheine-binding protein n=1 Tax=Streptomyces canus TaxID=58343 RepID=UPI0030DE266D
MRRAARPGRRGRRGADSPRRGDRVGAELDVDSLTLVEISIRIERDLGVHIDDNELQEGPGSPP